MNELTFNNHSVVPFDNGDGKIWFTADHLAELLGYNDAKQVNKIFQRHEAEFSNSMTMRTKVTKNGINNSLREISVRLFSPRGAHLIGMVSRTKVAKELRIWLLNLAEKESGIELGQLPVNELASLTGQKLHDAIAVFDQKSLAIEALDRIWLEGHRYMKAGVMLGDFYSEGVSQLNLFDENKPQANSEALMRVMDGLNLSGKGNLWFAGQGIQNTWAMKREMLSPAYTTKVSDLPVVRC